MLPERLSADLCSLRDGVDRLVLSVFIELDGHGMLHGFRFAEAVIRSRASLSYEQVQAALDGAVLAQESVPEDLALKRATSRCSMPPRARGRSSRAPHR